MQSKLLITLITISPIFSFCQPPTPAIAKEITIQSAMFIATFKQPDGLFFKKGGCGLLINHKYIATCYHLYHSENGYPLIDFKVMYNIGYSRNPSGMILHTQHWITQ